jgi:hypothetical protein
VVVGVRLLVYLQRVGEPPIALETEALVITF